MSPTMTGPGNHIRLKLAESQPDQTLMPNALLFPFKAPGFRDMLPGLHRWFQNILTMEGWTAGNMDAHAYNAYTIGRPSGPYLVGAGTWLTGFGSPDPTVTYNSTG